MSDIDSKIDALFNTLRAQQKLVSENESVSQESWATNCSIKLGYSTPVNIMTASLQQIILVAKDLRQYVEGYENALIVLGLAQRTTGNLEPVKVDGYLYSDWIKDLKKRIAVIQLREDKEKLSQLETRLNSIVSPEQKRAMELEAITKELLK